MHKQNFIRRSPVYVSELYVVDCPYCGRTLELEQHEDYEEYDGEEHECEACHKLFIMEIEEE